jgi:hypothetical protein
LKKRRCRDVGHRRRNPTRVTRVFFDCRNGATDPADLSYIKKTIDCAIDLAEAHDAAQEMLPLTA